MPSRKKTESSSEDSSSSSAEGVVEVSSHPSATLSGIANGTATATATDTTSFQLVSQGRLAPDLLVHATFHVTEIDDEVNTEIQNFSVECR